MGALGNVDYGVDEDRPAPDDAAFVRRWSLLGLALILVAAVQSDGFHQPDEHFQVLELAAYKLGRAPLADLPWEFRARIRSWLQPGLYVVLLRAAGALGLADPFRQALLLRLVSGLLSWTALVALNRVSPLLVPSPDTRQWAVRLSWLAFVTPYLAVRTSSECLATACAMLGLALFCRSTLGPRDWPRLLGAGLLLGLAAQFRFALGVMAAALLLWGVIERRLDGRGLAALLAAGLSTLGLGALVDRWGYGEWTLPALRYLQVNLGEGVAAGRFGSLPFYGYLTLALQNALAPLILLAFLGAAVAWVRAPRHVLTAATLPFVLVHALIAHKEMRFLFPLAPLAPYLLALAAAPRGELAPWLRRRPARVALQAFLVLDLVGLAALTVVPTRPDIGLQRYVYRRWPDRFEAFLLSSDSPWADGALQMHFYRPRELHLDPLASLDSIKERPRALVIAGPFDRPAQPGFSCEALYRPFPAWVEGLVKDRPVPGHSLHRCQRVVAAS